MERWYVFHTKPHKERQVADQLRQRGFDVFLPLAHVQRAHAPTAPERPYFPDYLFARVDLEAVGPSAVQWLPGLRQLVQFGGQPAVLPESFIFELKRHIAHVRAAGGLRLEGLERGATVRITSGPFAGYAGIFDMRLDGAERVRVLLEWVVHAQQHARRPNVLSRLIPVELSAGSVEKVRRKL